MYRRQESSRSRYASTGRGGSGGGRGTSRGKGHGGYGRGASPPRRSQFQRRDPGAGGASAAHSGIPPIDMKDQWHIQVFRPYPGEGGSAFIRRAGARGDRDIVDVEQLGDRLSLFNCEAMNRPGKWLSMLGATVQQAGKLASKYNGSLHLTGLPGVLEFLESEEGQSLVGAAAHLNDFLKNDVRLSPCPKR